MEMNTICRFLFESALYLDMNPARAFRSLCAELNPEHDDQAEDCLCEA